MAISYPLTMPTSPGVKRVTFHSANAVGLARSPWTYKVQVQNFRASSWAAEITLPSMTEEQVGMWKAFLLSLKGNYGTFYLGDPAKQMVSGTGFINTFSFTDIVIDGANQLGTSIATEHWLAANDGLLLPGDMIQFGNRLYSVLKQVDSDDNGLATIDVWPEVVDPTVDGDIIIMNDPKGVFRLVENSIEVWETDEAHIYDMSFSAVEAI